MNVAEIVTSKIIEQLEAGVAPWRKPWATRDAAFAASLISKKPYNGVNQFLLQLSGYTSPYWLTYKQAAALGGNVRKGEKGTPVIYVGIGHGKKTDTDDKANSYKFLKYFTVFNTEQCENLEAHVPVVTIPEGHAHSKIEAAELLVKGYNNAPTVIGASQAWYRSTTDQVGIPTLEQFETADAYYATLFHEFAHSTGHVSRLDRKLNNGFGSELYGKEELIAELAAAFLCNKAGIDTIPASASYCKSWITVLKGDAKLVISAAAAAQKAFDYIAPAAIVQQEQEAA